MRTELKKQHKVNLFNNSVDEIRHLYLLLTGKDPIIGNDIRYYNILPPKSCYYNLKDAVFHFYKMVSAQYQEEIFEQYNSLHEHINRARTDYYSSFLLCINYALREVMKAIGRDQLDDGLLELSNEVSLFLLGSRYGGMMMHSGVKCTDDAKFDKLVNKIRTTLQIIKNKDENIFNMFLSKLEKYKNEKCEDE